MKEHENATWLNREELGSVDWLPADVEVVKKLVGRNNVEIKSREAGGNVLNIYIFVYSAKKLRIQ